MGLGAVGGGTIGALVKANQFANGIEIKTASDGTKSVRTRTTLFGITKKLELLKTAQGLRVVAGAGIIQVAGIILSSIAIDQFVKIETARPKLEAALTEAKQAVDLEVLSNTSNGEDTLYLYWSRAMEATDPEDPQVLQLAATAQLKAEQTGYAAPPKTDQIISGSSTGTDTLSSGTSAGVLNQNEKLVSKNGKYELEMRDDGNLVIVSTWNRQAIWSSGTAGQRTAPYKLAMQSDANLVIYGNNNFVWNSGQVRTAGAPFRLVMQDDGNLCIYDSANRFIWNSGSYQAP
jgi:hypothetical protein